MSTWKTSVSRGISTTAPPMPVSAPSSPAPTDPTKTSEVNVSSGIRPPHDYSTDAHATEHQESFCQADNSYVPRNLAREIKRLRRAPNAHRIAFRRAAPPHPQPRARRDPTRFDQPQIMRVPVRDAVDHKRPVLDHICQHHRLPRRHLALHRRNRVPVRVDLGMPELGRDPFLEALRDEVLQPLRLRMHLCEWVVENFVEKRLNQPMMPHHLQCAPLPRTRELHPAMPLIRSEERRVGKECR